MCTEVKILAVPLTLSNDPKDFELCAAAAKSLQS